MERREREREKREERRDSGLSSVGADKPKRETEFNKARQGKGFSCFQFSNSPVFVAMGPTDGAATDGGVSEAEKLRTKTKYTRDPKAYDRWKTLVPYLYDFFTSHKMFWPSLSCRWGKVQSTEKYFTKQRFYFSEQTDSTSPNKLIVGIWDVVKVRTDRWMDKRRLPLSMGKRQRQCVCVCVCVFVCVL